MLGSVFKKNYDLNSEIDLLFAELRTIDSLKTMVATQGWHDLSSWIIARIVDLSDDIVSLAHNIDKNSKEIERKRWSISLYESILNAVGATLDEEEQKKNKVKHLEEIARIAEL